MWGDYGNGVTGAAKACGIDAVPEGAASGSATGTSAVAATTVVTSVTSAAATSAEESSAEETTAAAETTSAAAASSTAAETAATTAESSADANTVRVPASTRQLTEADSVRLPVLLPRLPKTTTLLPTLRSLVFWLSVPLLSLRPAFCKQTETQ